MRHDQEMMGWMGGLGFGHGWLGLLLLIVVVLAIAGLIKYLFGGR